MEASPLEPLCRYVMGGVAALAMEWLFLGVISWSKPCAPLGTTITPQMKAVPTARDERCLNDCQLVIAQCDEPLDWLDSQAPRYQRVFIYAKCTWGGRLTRLQRNMARYSNVEIIPSPNVGSNDYAILQHVIRHYDELAPLTVFCEAGWKPSLCSPDNVQRPTLEDGRATPWSPYVRLTQFKTGKNHKWPWTYPNEGPKGAHYAGTWTAQHWGTYVYGEAGKQAGRRQDKGSEFHQNFHKTNFSHLEAWLTDTAGEQLATYLLHHAGHLVLGGYFAAEAANLQRYPIELYRALAVQQRYPNEEVDHFIERTWGLLLTTPHPMPWQRSCEIFRPVVERDHKTQGASLQKALDQKELKPAYQPFVPADQIVRRKGYIMEG